MFFDTSSAIFFNFVLTYFEPEVCYIVKQFLSSGKSKLEGSLTNILFLGLSRIISLIIIKYRKLILIFLITNP